MKYEIPITYHSKDMANLKFLKSRSNFKVRRSKLLLTIERSCHKKYTYEIPITYHSKDMANDSLCRQTDKQTGTGQKVYDPFNMGA
jgi:hypothetical protein